MKPMQWSNICWKCFFPTRIIPTCVQPYHPERAQARLNKSTITGGKLFCYYFDKDKKGQRREESGKEKERYL